MHVLQGRLQRCTAHGAWVRSNAQTARERTVTGTAAVSQRFACWPGMWPEIGLLPCSSIPHVTSVQAGPEAAGVHCPQEADHACNAGALQPPTTAGVTLGNLTMPAAQHAAVIRLPTANCTQVYTSQHVGSGQKGEEGASGTLHYAFRVEGFQQQIKSHLRKLHT